MSLLLALLLCVPADTFTVDDDGLHADFPSLVAAVAAAKDGDILQVHPGTYDSFTLTKNITIMGPADGPHPKVLGRSVVHDSSGALIGGLDFGAFAAESVTGTLLLDDCTFGSPIVPSPSPSTVDLLSCDAVELQRSVVYGLDDAGGMGLHVADSRVSIVATQLLGGKGAPASALGCVGDGEKGGPAIRANDSKLILANCIVRGGKGGASCGPPALDGDAGDGLVVAGSLTFVRGAPTDSISDGPWDPATSAPGNDIVLTGGKLVISGVKYQPSKVLVSGGGLLLDAGHAEPWLTLNDAAGAGDVLELSLEGPPASPALFFGSILPELFTVPKLEAPLWLAADHSLFIFTLVTQGAGSPVVLPYTLPTGLDALDLHVQAVFGGLASAALPGKVVVTNPVSPLIRW
ncbi:MAG TPA: hypothetical protein VFY71_00945 [Planctomycetota bacterium]|nr:hypothetical protein [Planctomycetota bacterium]